MTRKMTQVFYPNYRKGKILFFADKDPLDIGTNLMNV